MNERINTLVKNSGLEIYGLGKDKEKWDSTVRKFAELIIKDCAGVYEAIDNGNEVEGTDNFLLALKRRYKE
jgi:hypothetical protein